MKLSSIMMAAAAAACLGIGSIAQATPTVTYTLVIGQNNGGATNVPGQWTLYADDSVGDNIGIAAMSVGIVAHINQATAATDLRIFNDMPQSNYTDSSGTASPNPLNAGFAASRANTASLYTGSAGPIPLTGSMDTTNTGGFYVITGFGQQPGTFPAVTSVKDALGDPYDGVGVTTQGTWEGHLKIAHGTYNTATLPDGPTIDPSTLQSKANVLISVPTAAANGVSTGTAQTVAADIGIVIVPIPEPATLGVASLGLLSLLARRRRRTA